MSEREIVEMCLNEGRNLTKWEMGFLETCADWLDEHETLTERMAEKLAEIHEEKADG